MKTAEMYYVQGKAYKELPYHLEVDGVVHTLFMAGEERLQDFGVKRLIHAIPENGKTITISHGELINGKWVEVIDEQLTSQEIAMQRLSYNFREITVACNTPTLQAKLDGLMDNREFRYHLIGAGGIVNLEDATTIEAMAVFTPEEILTIKENIANQ